MIPHLKRIIGSMALLSAVGLVGAGLAWYKYLEGESARSRGPGAEIPESVTTAPVGSISYRQSHSAVGTIVAPRWITLRNELAGRISAIHVKSGMVVEEGKTLIELDTSVERASLESAVAKGKLADLSYKRSNRLYKSQAATSSEIERSEAEMVQEKAEVARLNAVIARKTMQAPFRARVGLLNVYVGQYLAEGVDITTLQGVDRYVNVDFMLPQVVANQIEVGQRVTFEHLGNQLVGKIAAWDAKSDKLTRNMTVRAELYQPPPNLSPNDSIKATVEFGATVRAQAVPIEALRRTPMGAHVFVVEADAAGVLRAVSRTVQPGSVVGKQIAILGGLKEKEIVVADGSFKLRPGAAVQAVPMSDNERPSTPTADAQQASRGEPAGESRR